MKNKIKETKAITLIALVITIIVLLILAGVTIATLTGENGLLNRARTAKETSINAQIEENTTLDNYSNITEDYLLGTRTEVATSSFSKTVLWSGTQNATGTIILTNSIDNYDMIYVMGQYYELPYYGQTCSMNIFKEDYYDVTSYNGKNKFILSENVANQSRRIVYSFSKSTEITIDIIENMRLTKVYGVNL